MRYDVKLTSHAARQIFDVMAYITDSLFAPEAAAAWLDAIEDSIKALNSMPGRFPLIDREPWHSKGVRKMPVKNFIVYYFVEESRKTVWVTAVVYGRRNQLSALSEMPTNRDDD